MSSDGEFCQSEMNVHFSDSVSRYPSNLIFLFCFICSFVVNGVTSNLVSTAEVGQAIQFKARTTENSILPLKYALFGIVCAQKIVSRRRGASFINWRAANLFSDTSVPLSPRFRTTHRYLYCCRRNVLVSFCLSQIIMKTKSWQNSQDPLSPGTWQLLPLQLSRIFLLARIALVIQMAVNEDITFISRSRF